MGGYKEVPEIISLVGRKILSIRGQRIKIDKRVKRPAIEPKYFLFNDKKKELILELDEQDYYSHHDCNSYARTIRIIKDKEFRKQIFNDLVHYPIATVDIEWW